MFLRASMNGVMEMASEGKRPHGGFGCGIDPERGQSRIGNNGRVQNCGASVFQEGKRDAKRRPAAERHTNRAGKEKEQMIPLLKLAIGGGLWQLKGLPLGLVDMALHVEPAHRLVTITPFGPEGAAGYFTQDRVWIQKAHGDVMQERSAPRRSFDGHTFTPPWDKLHELYFVS